jgi:Gpi18-like mannosyltransferase
MKILAISLMVLSLTACGDMNDRTNKILVQKYMRECQDQGYQSARVTYIMGMVSNYYTCE